MNLFELRKIECSYDRLYALFYLGTNIFLICYSIANPESLSNISAKWYPEIILNCPRAIVGVVSTKLDLRDDKENPSCYIRTRLGQGQRNWSCFLLRMFFSY